MPPPESEPVATAAAGSARWSAPPATTGLDDLLATVPGSAISAATDLAAAAARSVGTPVTVLVEAEQSWMVVAGPKRAAGPAVEQLRTRLALRAGALCAGRAAVLWDAATALGPAERTTLTHACAWLSLAIERDEAGDGARRSIA
jgi:hypothetical protein